MQFFSFQMNRVGTSVFESVNAKDQIDPNYDSDIFIQYVSAQTTGPGVVRVKQKFPHSNQLSDPNGHTRSIFIPICIHRYRILLQFLVFSHFISLRINFKYNEWHFKSYCLESLNWFRCIYLSPVPHGSHGESLLQHDIFYLREIDAIYLLKNSKKRKEFVS